MNEILYIIIPCFNEEKVLPIASKMFLDKLEYLIKNKNISDKSRILFVDDGSKDTTWKIINDLSKTNAFVSGIKLSRNRGHQNALLAGISEVKDKCDISISIDCDGQDDIDAMDKMIDKYRCGFEVVYGVRDSRDTDSFFKKFTAENFYKLMKRLGDDSIYNHADYRLMSNKIISALLLYDESNLYLRGVIPLIGYKSDIVKYDRKSRIEGKTHYSLCSMINLAINGITNISIKPLRIIFALGIIVSLISFIGVIYSLIRFLSGNTISGWTSTVCILCFMFGVQFLCIGIIGEYIGKIYVETKHRPKFIIEEKTNI